MTKDDAWKIVQWLADFDESQMSKALAIGGQRTSEDDIYDYQRLALKKAWSVISEIRETSHDQRRDD